MISIIVAVGNQMQIGKNNALLWKLKDDMALFREKTKGKTVIMGRNTFESMGRRPLVCRDNIVVSNTIAPMEGIRVATSVEDAIKMANEDIFIIGGEGIYKHGMLYADEMHITYVDSDIDGDVYFQPVDYTKWDVVSNTEFLAGDGNECGFSVVHLVRKLDK